MPADISALISTDSLAEAGVGLQTAGTVCNSAAGGAAETWGCPMAEVSIVMRMVRRLVAW